jgi:transglutaminase-like putative cysteine protease
VEGVVLVNGDAERSAGWKARKKWQRTLVLLLVLMVTLGSVACGLSYAAQGLDAGLLLTLAAIGMLVGWVMATLRLAGWQAVATALISGAFLPLVCAGHLGGELAAVLSALLPIPWCALRWLFGGPPPDWAAVPLALSALGLEVGALFIRLGGWFLRLVDGNPVLDPVAMVLVWGLVMWAVAVWAGWKVRLYQPLRGLAPASALLAITLYVVGASSFSLLWLLGAMLLLMAMIRQDARERRWQEAGINFSRYIWRDLAMKAVSLSLTLVVVAALMPTISVDRVAEAVERLTEAWEGKTESTGESLGLEARPETESGSEQETLFGGVGVSTLPRRHLLGSGTELSRRVVMLIRTDDLRPGLAEPTRRYYWRSTTYDRYDGHGWSTSRMQIVAYEAGEPATSEDLPFHRVVRQEVRVLGNVGEMIHVAGSLVTADQDYRVAWRSPGDALGATTEATVYRVDSLVPFASAGQLRLAGSDYPEWVQERYVALPDDVPERVLSLARDLTATEPTPYEQARAIEVYLRGIPYTLDVPVPPMDRDVVDYFLFDLRKGYCDYYATAMAVLARAAGLPARFVMGYANGTYDEVGVQYVVAEADAHSWVEIYFPEYGWVAFEPTGGRPAIVRPAESDLSEFPEPEPLGPAGGPEPTAASKWAGLRWSWWLGLTGGLALLALVGVTWSVADQWRLCHLKPAAAVTALYERLRCHGRRLAVPMRSGDTPYEFAASLAAWVAGQAQKKQRAGTLSPVIEEARRLIDWYVQASYSPLPPDGADQAQAIQTWHRLRWRLWLARVWGKLFNRR